MSSLWDRIRLPLCTVMIAVGTLILIWQGVEHIRAAQRGPLKPFDEDGERVGVPFLGVVGLGGGIFLLVLTSGRKTEKKADG